MAADVAAARRADVLVGTHGAALTYGFYMRRGAALVEVRPYRFEGKWPDRYFRDLAALEQSPLYFQATAAPAPPTPALTLGLTPTRIPSPSPCPTPTPNPDPNPKHQPPPPKPLNPSPNPQPPSPALTLLPGDVGQRGAEHPAPQGDGLRVGRARPPRAPAVAHDAQRARGGATGRQLTRALPAARRGREACLREPAIPGISSFNRAAAWECPGWVEYAKKVVGYRPLLPSL